MHAALVLMSVCRGSPRVPRPLMTFDKFKRQFATHLRNVNLKDEFTRMDLDGDGNLSVGKEQALVHELMLSHGTKDSRAGARGHEL